MVGSRFRTGGVWSIMGQSLWWSGLIQSPDGVRDLMTKISPDFDEPVPAWDVALEGLLREEHARRRSGLTVEHIEQLCVQYRIRFDDMMHTLFELTVRGRWRYLPEPDVIAQVTRQDVDALWSEGRLFPERARAHYPGAWRAVKVQG